MPYEAPIGPAHAVVLVRERGDRRHLIRLVRVGDADRRLEGEEID